MKTIVVTITDPEYECDVTQVLDHEHPGFFDCILEVSDDFETLEWVAQEAHLVELINQKLGVCMLAGDLDSWSEELNG
jgi:hypothetical protein